MVVNYQKACNENRQSSINIILLIICIEMILKPLGVERNRARFSKNRLYTFTAVWRRAKVCSISGSRTRDSSLVRGRHHPSPKNRNGSLADLTGLIVNCGDDEWRHNSFKKQASWTQKPIQDGISSVVLVSTFMFVQTGGLDPRDLNKAI